MTKQKVMTEKEKKDAIAKADAMPVIRILRDGTKVKIPRKEYDKIAEEVWYE
ncbi:MAG: hypothetical protein KGI04_00545 [Candidatus Micrarchaeota archaeon]|nr:hypothetical protein [Candidatus Micrarchaeota archaeon]